MTTRWRRCQCQTSMPVNETIWPNSFRNGFPGIRAYSLCADIRHALAVRQTRSPSSRIPSLPPLFLPVCWAFSQTLITITDTAPAQSELGLSSSTANDVLSGFDIIDCIEYFCPAPHLLLLSFDQAPCSLEEPKPKSVHFSAHFVECLRFFSKTLLRKLLPNFTRKSIVKAY